MAKHRHNPYDPTAPLADGGAVATAELPPPADPQPNGNPDHPAQPAAMPAKRIRKAPLVPKDETKAARFARLAPRRRARAKKAIAAVANLASRGSYECSDAQREWLLAGVIEATQKAIDRFGGIKSAAEEDAMPA
jgi:hypothetical protein